MPIGPNIVYAICLSHREEKPLEQTDNKENYDENN